jgi:MGT family glycosyltransferase
MARFLLTVWPIQTHISPNLALARELRDQGHQVAFYTGQDWHETIGREGFPCFGFRDVNADEVFAALHSILSQWGRARRPGRLWQRFLVESVPAQVRDIQAISEEWKPDVIVTDMAMWGPILVLHEMSPIPVAVLSHIATCILPGRYGPTPGICLPWPQSGWERLRARIAQKAVRVATARVPRAASAVRATYGLDPLDTTVTDYSGRLPLYLVPGAPELDYQRNDLPASVHYVGAFAWDEPPSEAASKWVADWRGEGPCVLVTGGTLNTPEPKLLHVAARAFAGGPMATVIVAGKGRDPKTLGLPESPYVRVESWTPPNHSLPLADVVVTNGNTEVVLPALSRGLPMVLVPSMLEQGEMAWRVAQSGAGVRLSARRCTPARLRAAVEQVLGEPSYRRNAERLAEALARCGGSGGAAALLAQLARGSRRLTTA